MKLRFRKQKKTKRRVNRPTDVKVNRYISPRRKRSGEIANKRKTTKRKRLAWKVLVYSTLVLAGGFFLWNNSRVTDVAMSVEQEIYRPAIEQYLSRNPVASFKPFVSGQAVSDVLTNEYPEIELVSVRLPFFGESMEVTIVERRAQLVLQTGENQYLIVDSNGYAYDTYDPKMKNDRVVILEDDTEVAYDLKDNRFVASGVVEFIEVTNEGLKTVKQYAGQSFSYRITDEARIIYVKPSKQAYEIKMQLDGSPVEQINSLKSALNFYTAKGISPAKYVDVRVNGTVYYK